MTTSNTDADDLSSSRRTADDDGGDEVRGSIRPPIRPDNSARQMSPIKQPSSFVASASSLAEADKVQDLIALGVPTSMVSDTTAEPPKDEEQEPSSAFLTPAAEPAPAAAAAPRPSSSSAVPTSPKDMARQSLRTSGVRRSVNRDSQIKAAASAARASAGTAAARPGAVAVNTETPPPPASSSATSADRSDSKAAVFGAVAASAVRPGAVSVASTNEDGTPTADPGRQKATSSGGSAQPPPSRGAGLQLAPPSQIVSSRVLENTSAGVVPNKNESDVVHASVPNPQRPGANNISSGTTQNGDSIRSQPGAVSTRTGAQNDYDKSEDSFMVGGSFDKGGHNNQSFSNLPVAMEAELVVDDHDDAEKGYSKNNNNNNGGEGQRDPNLAVAVGERDSCWTFWKRSRSLQIGTCVIVLVIIAAIVGLSLALSKDDSSEPQIVQTGGSDTAEEEEPFFDQIGLPLDGPVKISNEHGSSISLSGDGSRMAVADNDDVYIYDMVMIDPTVAFSNGNQQFQTLDDGQVVNMNYEWLLVATIEAPGNATVGEFTNRHDMVRTPVNVDLSKNGDFIAIGWPYAAAEGEPSAGCVEVYRASTSSGGFDTEVTFEQLGNTMYGWGESDFFGAAIALSGTGGIIAIGAPGNNGHADIFTLNKDTWVTQGDFISLDGNLLVGSVSIDETGQTFAVGGHPVSTDDEDTAVVRIFRFVAGNWEELGEGIVGNFQDTAYIAALSANGNIVAVSNYYRGEAGPAEGGTNDALDVRAFELDESTKEWVQLGENLHALAPGEKSGYFITLSDDGMVMGMGDPGRESADGGGVTGHAHIYQYDEETGLWDQRRPNKYGESPGDQFGFAVAISGDGTRFAVGSPFNRGDGREKGRVYVYDTSADLTVV